MTKTIVVEKVPLEYRPTDTPPLFPSLPVLYLEFLENKDKVKQDLRDKPSAPIFLPEPIQSVNPNVEFYRPDERTPKMYKSPESNVRNKLKERMKHGKDEKPRSREVVQDHRSVKERQLEEEREKERSKQYTDQREKTERTQQEGKHQPRSTSRERQTDRHQEELPRSSTRPHKPESRERSPQTQEILDMLGGENAARPNTERKEVPLPSTIPYNVNDKENKPNLPPTLSQLGAGDVNVNGRVMKDISYTTDEETAKKRELLFRFEILRKSYKEAHIPEYSEFTDLRTLERTYEETVRRVALDGKVDGYKKFLTMGFFGIELLFSNVFKLDMSGFAKQQMVSMNSYERILIELGEKSLLEKTKSQWPAEVRLLFTIVINAVMFILMKSVMSGGLSNLMGGGGGGGGMGGIMGMVSGLMGGMMGGGGGGGGGLAGMMGGGGETQPSAAAEAESSKPKPAAGRKMKGPSVNLDEIGKKTN
jgi:hypothetical protein